MKVAIMANAKIKNQEQLNKKLLNETAAKYNLTYELYFCEPDKIDHTLKELLQKPFNAFLIVGGDGTVRSAAQILVDQDIPIAIFPAGTFNHFAKELNYPQDIDTLFKIIKNNKLKQVDVAEVNNNIFINNSSIGFYSHVLKLKEKYQDLLAQSKLLKVIFTAFNIFKTIPVYQLKMQIENKETIFNTCLVFIGNNYYHTTLPKVGDRDSLSTGLLAVYVLKCKNRWDIFKCALAMVFNTAGKKKYLFQTSTNDLTISSKSAYINVILDGELFKLKSPLHYTIHHKKLPVIIP